MACERRSKHSARLGSSVSVSYWARCASFSSAALREVMSVARPMKYWGTLRGSRTTHTDTDTQIALPSLRR